VDAENMAGARDGTGSVAIGSGVDAYCCGPTAAVPLEHAVPIARASMAAKRADHV
jgi:hypothetical protein